MTHPEYIHLHSAIRQPFATVRDTVQLRTATTARNPEQFSMEWLHGAAASLGVHVVGLDLAAPVTMTTSEYTDIPSVLPAGIVHLTFKPTDYGKLAPVLEADVEIQAVDEETTMVSMLGEYHPPFGAVGIIADRVVMHRVAEAGLQRFFAALLRELRTAPVRG